MKKILFTLMTIVSLSAYAEWEDAETLFKNANTKEEIISLLKEHEKEFFIPANRSKNGIQITATDLNREASVHLRFKNNVVDYKVNIYKAHFDGNTKLYLNLLDEDKFLIGHIHISDLCDQYTGELFGTFKMDFSDFKQIKYYQFSGVEI